MPGRVVDGAERFRETARARLELDEVPAILARPLHSHRGEGLRRPLLTIGVAPGSDGRTVGHVHRQRRRDTLPSGHWFEFKLDLVIHMASAAARLRAAAEAKPLRLPINRRVDESHHLVTPDGLSVWYTIQVSPHSRIQEAIFEREDGMPTDEECKRWLDLLIVGAQASEAPGLPGAMTRRFEAFEHSPDREAPIA